MSRAAAIARAEFLGYDLRSTQEFPGNLALRLSSELASQEFHILIQHEMIQMPSGAGAFLLAESPVPQHSSLARAHISIASLWEPEFSQLPNPKQLWLLEPQIQDIAAHGILIAHSGILQIFPDLPR